MSKKNELSLLTTECAIFSQTQKYILNLLQKNNQELSEYIQESIEQNPFLAEEEDGFFSKKHGQMHWMDRANRIENFPARNLWSDEIEVSQIAYEMNLIVDCDFDNAPAKIPDVVIEVKGNYDLECYINDFFPLKIFLNENLYRKSCSAIRNENDKSFIKTQFESAKLLIKSISSRNFILLRIMKEIIFRQSDFLLGKREYMVPVDIKDVAITLLLRKNTVQKTVENKIVQTPRGIFSLNSLFPKKTKSAVEISHLESDIEVKKYINQLINNEPKHSPYSDDEIVCLLNSRGISLSCSMVTKYRKNLNIPNLKQRNKIYNLLKLRDYSHKYR